MGGGGFDDAGNGGQGGAGGSGGGGGGGGGSGGPGGPSFCVLRDSTSTITVVNPTYDIGPGGTGGLGGMQYGTGVRAPAGPNGPSASTGCRCGSGWGSPAHDPFDPIPESRASRGLAPRHAWQSRAGPR